MKQEVNYTDRVVNKSMKIGKNTYIIKTVYKNRKMNYYLLIGKDQSIVVDSGFTFTARENIIPYLKNLGFNKKSKIILINTHASADHSGGNAVLKKEFTRTKIVAHKVEVESIANIDHFVKTQLEWAIQWGIPYPAINMKEFRTLQEEEIPVDWPVENEASIELENGRKVILYHSPGHTPGHLVVFDPATGFLFGGDSVMGRGIPGAGNSVEVVMPPHYFSTKWYLETISLIKSIRPSTLFLTHYDPICGKEVEKFLQESEQFTCECTSALDKYIKSTKKNKKIITKEVLDFYKNRIGVSNCENQYRLLAMVHLQELWKKNIIEPAKAKDYSEWTLVSNN